MKLFEFDKKNFDVNVTEEALLLAPFNVIFKKDKTKDKSVALKEIAFVWFFADITSPYQSILDETVRAEEIIKDTEMPLKWTKSKEVDNAIIFYKERSKTAIHSLYEAAMIAASSVDEVFRNSKELIADSRDKIAAAEKVIGALEKLPKAMQKLEEVEKILLRKINDTDGKKSGSKTFNTFEGMEGLI